MRMGAVRFAFVFCFFVRADVCVLVVYEEGEADAIGDESMLADVTMSEAGM